MGEGGESKNTSYHVTKTQSLDAPRLIVASNLLQDFSRSTYEDVCSAALLQPRFLKNFVAVAVWFFMFFGCSLSCPPSFGDVLEK